MTLRARLAAGMLAIAVVLIIPLLLTLRSLEELHQSALALRNTEFAASLLLGRIRGRTEDLRRAEDALLFVHDSASQIRMSREIASLSAMADSLEAYALDSAARHLRAAVAAVDENARREYVAALARRTTRADSLSAAGVRPAISRMEQWTGEAEASLRVRTRDRCWVSPLLAAGSCGVPGRTGAVRLNNQPLWVIDRPQKMCAAGQRKNQQRTAVRGEPLGEWLKDLGLQPGGLAHDVSDPRKRLQRQVPAQRVRGRPGRRVNLHERDVRAGLL
jgi:hypothetical protein